MKMDNSQKCFRSNLFCNEADKQINLVKVILCFWCERSVATQIITGLSLGRYGKCGYYAKEWV